MNTSKEGLTVEDILERIGFDKKFADFLRNAFNKASLAGEQFKGHYHPDVNPQFIGYFIGCYPNPYLNQIEISVRPVVKTKNGCFSDQQDFPYVEGTNSWRVPEEEVIRKEDINF